MHARETYARSLAHVSRREELPMVLNARGLVGVAVEVGVETGWFSEHLLRFWGGELLISVDPWREQPAAVYRDACNRAQEVQDRLFHHTLARLAPYGPRTQVWRKYSAEAAACVWDNSLDFVYLDARHDYRSVVEDLAAWTPKVRRGGIIAGHDYLDGLFEAEYGVASAVDRWFGALGVQIFTTHEKDSVRSWLIEVPR